MDACERSGRISLRFVAIQFCNIFLQEGERWSSKRHVTFGCDSKNGYVVRVSDLVDLWVIMIKMPMILCARACSMSRSREQSTKRRSRSKNMQMVCLFYSQNNKIECLSTMTVFLEEFARFAKVCGLSVLDCAFCRMLIGWAGKLWSHGCKALHFVTTNFPSEWVRHALSLTAAVSESSISPHFRGEGCPQSPQSR